MPAILKKLEGTSIFSPSSYFLVLAAVSIIVLGVYALSASSDLPLPVAAVIVATPVVLTLAVVWSVCEIRRLHR